MKTCITHIIMSVSVRESKGVVTTPVNHVFPVEMTFSLLCDKESAVLRQSHTLPNHTFAHMLYGSSWHVARPCGQEEAESESKAPDIPVNPFTFSSDYEVWLINQRMRLQVEEPRVEPMLLLY